MITIEIMSKYTEASFKIKITEDQLEKLALKLIKEIKTTKNEQKSKEC
jgi:hypothetical protein